MLWLDLEVGVNGVMLAKSVVVEGTEYLGPRQETREAWDAQEELEIDAKRGACFRLISRDDPMAHGNSLFHSDMVRGGLCGH